MHIVVEGFDGTGKSTLCRLLSLATDWPVVRQAPIRPSSEEEYETICERAQASAQKSDLISDRWPSVTNYCYRAAGQSGDFMEVVASLRAANVDRIIHCDVDAIDDLRTANRRWRFEAWPNHTLDPEHMDRVRIQARRILLTYRELMEILRTFGFDVHRYVMIGLGGV